MTLLQITIHILLPSREASLFASAEGVVELAEATTLPLSVPTAPASSGEPAGRTEPAPLRLRLRAPELRVPAALQVRGGVGGN